MRLDELLYIYYVYLYLREDGTPYYVGKGSGDRAYRKGKGEVRPLKDLSNVMIVAKNLNESEAFTLEKKLIKIYGRKDLNTGILRNKTNGGDGPSGAKRSDAHKAAIAESNRNRVGKIKHTNEWKVENSKRMIGNQHSVGNFHTDEWKQENGNRMRGNNHAAALKGHIQPTITCPHCGNAGGVSLMKRWHFDKCRNIQIN